MKTVVIYESMTGTTAKAAAHIAAELRRNGHEATVFRAGTVDSAAVLAADLVFLGTWVKGHFVVRQKPAGAKRLAQLPQLDGKRVVTFCTYALSPGTTMNKLDALVASLGGTAVGGLAIVRHKVEEQAIDLVGRALAALVDA
jgi:flavodoxin